MRLAAIGNSHLGSLKRGWDMIAPEFPDVQITFFAARGNATEKLEAIGGFLVPTTEELEKCFAFTSGGLSRIEVDQYDAILIYGLWARPFFAVPGAFYSQQAKDRAFGRMVESVLYFRILKLVRTIFGGPIYLGHEPLLAARDQPDECDPEEYRHGMATFNETVFAPLQARMISQPAQTIAHGRHTHGRFSEGSKRLAIGDDYDDELHDRFDYRHMNDEFGALWLRKFFEDIDASG